MTADLIENIKLLFSKFTDSKKFKNKFTLDAEFSQFLDNEMKENRFLTIQNYQPDNECTESKTSEISRAGISIQTELPKSNQESECHDSISTETSKKSESINLHAYQKLRISFKNMWSPNKDRNFSTPETIKYLKTVKDMGVFRCDKDLIFTFLDHNKCRHLILGMKDNELQNLDSFSMFIKTFRYDNQVKFEHCFETARQAKHESFKSYHIRLTRLYMNSKGFNPNDILCESDRRWIESKFRATIYDEEIKDRLTNIKNVGEKNEILRFCEEVKRNRSFLFEKTNCDQKSYNDILNYVTNQVRLAQQKAHNKTSSKMKNPAIRRRKSKFLKIARIRNRFASDESQVYSD